MSTIRTMIFGGACAVRANWAEASSQIECLGDDGWLPMGRQVADFSHIPADALREHIIRACEVDRDDIEIMAEVDGAVAGAVEE